MEKEVEYRIELPVRGRERERERERERGSISIMGNLSVDSHRPSLADPRSSEQLVQRIQLLCCHEMVTYKNSQQRVKYTLNQEKGLLRWFQGVKAGFKRVKRYVVISKCS